MSMAKKWEKSFKKDSIFLFANSEFAFVFQGEKVGET